MTEQKFISPEINSADALSARLIEVGLQLEATNNRLLESEKARSRILQNISHDLRAPLAAVRGGVDRLMDNPAEEERNKLLGIIDRRLISLEKLVDELHLSQKLEQPEFTLKKEDIEVAQLLEEYYIQMQVSGKYDERELNLILPEDTEVLLALDVDHFLRVLDNLTTNALQHSGKGDSIALSLDFDDNNITITVSDTGEGIAPEHLELIWTRTFTASGARTPNKSGSGLGLHITQLIVEKHGGKISCESVQDSGTSFIIVLPR